MKNTMSRRRELRERNEELRILHQRIAQWNPITEVQNTWEEVLNF